MKYHHTHMIVKKLILFNCKHKLAKKKEEEEEIIVKEIGLFL